MIFLDTSAFLAIENKKDNHHHEAIVFRDSCLKEGKAFITTDYVLDESYTMLRFRAGRKGESRLHFSLVTRIKPIFLRLTYLS